jgi:transposase-like protein
MFKILQQTRRFSTASPTAATTQNYVPKVKGPKELLYHAVSSLQKANSNQIVKFCTENHPGVFASKKFIKKLLKQLVGARKLITEVPKDGVKNHLYRLTLIEARRKERREAKYPNQ